MFKQKIRFGLIIACCLCAGLLSSCMPIINPASEISESKTNPQTTATTATTAPQFEINPLTGIANIKPGDWTRPVSFMIGNNSKSRPQIGIEKADLYFEAETEGGITRIMAVFAGASRVPEKLGPIRSARTPFIKIAESLGAIYCHAGGSRTGLNLLKTADVSSINALGSNGSAFGRDPTLKSTKGTEYSLLAYGSKLAARIKSLKLSTRTSKPSPFNFGGSPTGSGAGKKVQVRFSGYQTVSFYFDPVTELYFKSNGSLENGTAHKSQSGETLTATNIIIMYDQKYQENEQTIGFNLASGTGLLVSGGASRDIRWNRTKDRLQFTETDGTALNLPAGKSYICLTDNSNKAYTVLA